MFALQSQMKTKLAQQNGYFKSEIVPVQVAGMVDITVDEFPKPNTTIDNLNKLLPPFKKDVS